ncbi:TrbC/VirB2 family protein [Erythrobacter sp. GH1-10]|uniref:TrbC/VirB2 family protein n=1 Tax=Erythrobacter sp. GH1-10 TaxID=3349334 RepID=UPI003877DADA
MAAPIQSSLLEPVGSAAIGSSVDWMSALMFGSLAFALCVIAVAFVGMLMLTGRFAVREGMRVTLGCFILLGAPAVATASREN